MIKSINPATGQIIAEYQEISAEEVEVKLQAAQSAFETWRQTDFPRRSAVVGAMARILRERKAELAMLATNEMGKPLAQAEAEIEKCATTCDYFAQNGERFLQPEIIETEAAKSYVRFDPLGVVLEVMPWNFPFWQVFRVTAPLLMAGNTAVLKHASNVAGCALAIEQIVHEAAGGEKLLQVLLINSGMVEDVIKFDVIVGVSLTGSEYAGSQVAMQAGREIKKVVMELGGSDAFIVLPDADLPKTIEMATKGRLQNNSQSCVAAKRFIVHKSVADQFIAGLKASFEAVKVGDPLDRGSELGPLVSAKSLEEVDAQVQQSVAKGAKLITGGAKWGDVGAYYKPTILTDVAPGMPAYGEEIFGPVASVIVVDNEEEAVRVANDHRYGLGCSIWTNDIEKAQKIAVQIEAGNVFINDITKSHPKLPVGGIKKSGFGRELSHIGIREFVNIKTVWVG